MAKRKYQTRREAGIILAVCGAISGLLSNYATIDGAELFGVPMLPALFFGIVIALGIYSWESHNPIPILIVFAGVVIGWWCAYRLAVTLHDEKNKTALLWIGAASGFVGALITSISLWIASEDFRQNLSIVKTVLFGAVAGTLLYFMQSSGPIHGLAPLFVVWQAGVAGIVGYALAYRPRPE
jgi:CDP-diglyceride synthetase